MSETDNNNKAVEQAAKPVKTAKKTKKVKKRKGILRILPEKPGYMVVLLLMALLAIAFLAMMAVMNSFPTEMTMWLIGALFGLLLVVWILIARKSRVLRIIGLVLALVFFGVFGLGTYYMGSTYAMLASISGNNDSEVPAGQLDVTKESFNIYITGIDQWASEKGYDLERSDVNMIVTVCPLTRKILLTSIPRDSYVELYHVPEMDKLTHTGIYGVEETIKTVEKWLGLDLNYYVKMNFSAVRDIINAMGGIDVYSPVAFKTSLWGYNIEKGVNHMTGKKALYFARERKAFEGKDSIRVENQQRVVKACIDKMTTSTVLLTKYGDIMKAAGRNLSTNMTTDDMSRLVKMQLQDLGTWDVQMQKIEGEYDMDYVASLTQEQKFQVYKPDPASVQANLNKINEVMNPSEAEVQAYREAYIENKKKESFINFIRKFTGKAGNQDSETDEAA
ncbi:MAG: LCP family protein [Mogibacterium sp.]|nr:LCP family protein [Mogibacterium sp.]